jgi:hypothetical protein
MGKDKGGSQTTKVEIPEWLEKAAQKNMARADEIATLGYVPRFGPEVAAFTPMQQAAFANTAQAANAFGLPGGDMTGMEGVPTPTTYANGVQGYSSTPLYNDMLAELEATAPGQYDFIRGMFIDPVTGAAPRYPFASEAQRGTAYGAEAAPAYVNPLDRFMGQYSPGGTGYVDPYSDGSNAYSPAGPAPVGGFQGPNLDGSAGYGTGGYTSFGDRFDRGGPGRSGGPYSGGGVVSAAANLVTGRS